MKKYLIMLYMVGSAHAAEPNHSATPASLAELHFETNRHQEQFFLTCIVEHLLKSDIDLNKKSVVSIGCGAGGIEHHLATLTPIQSIHCVDARKDMIDFCLTKHRDLYNKLSFQRCCAEDFGARNVYDFALAPSCFNEFQDKQKALSTIYGSLKRGGQFFANIETTSNAESFAMKAYYDLLQSIPLIGSLLTIPKPTGSDRLTYGQLHVLLTQAGFDVETLKTEQKSCKWTMSAEEWRKVQLPILLSTDGAQYLVNTTSDNWYAQKASETAFWWITMSPEEKEQHDAPFFPEIKDELVEKIRKNDFCRCVFNKFLNLCLNHMQKNDDGTYTWKYDTTFIRAQKK